MGKSRFYSLALGKELNFQARTDGLITQADTTPSVGIFSLLYSDSANTITYLDDGAEGQVAVIMNIAASDILTLSGGQMKMATSAPLLANESVTLLNHNSAWYEIARGSKITAEGGVVTAAYGDSSPSVRGAAVLVLPSTTKLLITALDDGYDGQRLTIIKVNSCYNTISNGATAVMIAESAQNFVLVTSGTIEVIRYGGIWYAIGVAFTGN